MDDTVTGAPLTLLVAVSTTLTLSLPELGIHAIGAAPQRPGSAARASVAARRHIAVGTRRHKPGGQWRIGSSPFGFFPPVTQAGASTHHGRGIRLAPA